MARGMMSVAALALALSLSGPVLAKKADPRKAASKAVRNNRRKRRASAFTGRKKLGLQVIQRLPSSETPPPGTTQWTCG